MTIREKIKFLRESNNMTQDEFSKIAKIGRKSIHTWESGISVPRMSCIDNICEYFKIPRSYLLDDDIDITSETKILCYSNSAPSKKDELINLIKKTYLTDDQLDLTIALIKSYIK